MVYCKSYPATMLISFKTLAGKSYFVDVPEPYTNRQMYEAVERHGIPVPGGKRIKLVYGRYVIERNDEPMKHFEDIHVLFAPIIAAGGRRKGHARKSHGRKSHPRKTHPRKSHGRKSHGRKTPCRRDTMGRFVKRSARRV